MTDSYKPGDPPLVRYSPDPGRYVRVWYHVLSGGTVKFEWCGRAEGRREFLRALDRRITARGGPAPSWRKLDPDWQTELRRDAQELADHRAWRRRLHGLNGMRWRTDLVQRRLGHLFNLCECCGQRHD